MRELSADLLASQEPEHGAPEEAIAYAQGFDAVYQPANDAAFAGAVVESVLFNDLALQVLTAKGGIAVHLTADRLAHCLLDSGDTGLEPTPDAQAAVQVVLRGSRFVWDRPAIANSIVGTRLLRVAGSLDRVWLYFSGIGIVAASALVNKTSGEPFLYWDYSD